MKDYKGIYFNKSTEQKFYEGGAHFRYKDLYIALQKLQMRYLPHVHKINSQRPKTRNAFNQQQSSNLISLFSNNSKAQYSLGQFILLKKANFLKKTFELNQFDKNKTIDDSSRPLSLDKVNYSSQRRNHNKNNSVEINHNEFIHLKDNDFNINKYKLLHNLSKNKQSLKEIPKVKHRIKIQKKCIEKDGKFFSLDNKQTKIRLRELSRGKSRNVNNNISFKNSSDKSNNISSIIQHQMYANKLFLLKQSK